MKVPDYLKPSVNYIKNSGKYNIVSETYYCLIKDFDEDYKPAGAMIRDALVKEGIAQKDDDHTFLMLL